MLTVLFATRNGAHRLEGVLESYRALRPPPGGWKLVVVDNGSTDESLNVLARYAARLPLTTLQEQAPGKNAALNAGLAQLEGDLAVLTDDDVFPHADWLARLRAAADAHPLADVFGGHVLARWEVPPPPWVLEWVLHGPVFALTPPNTAAGPTERHNIFGPNMMVRTTLFTKGLRFDTRIGPRGEHYAMGSETEFVARVLRAGGTAWFVPDAVVEHFIPRQHLDRRWIIGRAYRFGRGQYRLTAGEVPARAARWWGAPRYLYREMLGSALSAAAGFATGDAGRRFRALWALNVARGRAFEASVMWRENRAGPTA